jgi:hypothetical protein
LNPTHIGDITPQTPYFSIKSCSQVTLFTQLALYHLTAKQDARTDLLRRRLKKKMEMARVIYLNRKEESVRSE